MDSPSPNDDSPNAPRRLLLFDDLLESPPDPAEAPMSSSQDSSNGFEKLEKPADLFADFHPPPPPANLMDSITPSDEVAPPIGEDMSDFAASAKDAADEMAAYGKESLQDFLKQESPVDEPIKSGQPVDFDPYRLDEEEEEEEEEEEGTSARERRDVVGAFASAFDHEPPVSAGDRPLPADDEHTFERAGPLLVGQPQHTAPPPAATGRQDDFDLLADLKTSAATEVADFGGDRSPPAVRPPTPPKPREPPTPPIIDLGPKRRATDADSTPTEGGSCCSFDFKSVNPNVLELIYWRDPKRSGVVFATTLITLILLARLTLVSFFAYAGLLAVGTALALYTYRILMTSIKKTDTADPIKPYLEQEVRLPSERVHQQVDVLLDHGQCMANQMRRLLLVEHLGDTLKFGVLLWALTYIGAWFSGMTLVIIAFIGLFTIPKIYEIYKEPIDKYYGIAMGHVKNATDMIQDKLPFLKKKQN